MRFSSSSMRRRSRAPVEFLGERGLDGAAAFVAEDDEERRAQVHRRVLQRAHDFRRNHVARDAHDEELAEVRVEHQLRRHARIAAADDGGVGLLLLRQLGKDFLFHGGKARPAGDEALVAADQASQGLVRRRAGSVIGTHTGSAPAGVKKRRL